VQALVTAGAGFLLAVLWFDLMFDVQVRGGATDAAVESIATYYARVTRAARPMNRLVALAMLATIVAVIAEVVGDSVPRWAAFVSVPLILAPVALAGSQTVPAAVRLGQRVDPPEVRRTAAVHILRQHVVCFACIALLLAVQLTSLA
jgi:hypothetical protein